MFKLFHPNKIFQITSKAPKYVLILFVMVLSVGLTEALILSPEDYKQSDAVRIMYVHVPAAWISLGIFSSITFLSISGFIFKNKNFFLIAKSLAPSGFVFNIIALVTGAIWGKPTWGTWWAWDARITSMLILGTLLCNVFNFMEEFMKVKRRFLRSQLLLPVLGIVNVPIIKYSVDWWNTLHQPASINILSKSSIHSSMLFPLLIMTAAFALFSLLIFLMKYNTELIKIKNKGLDRL
jgi:heme exporter protein C